MPTDPWSGSRYPASSAAPNVSQDIQNAVNDLADGTTPAFASPAARDTAFTNWKNAGNIAFSGLQAFTQSDGRLWRYDTASSSWLYAGGNPPPIVAVSLFGGWSVGDSMAPGVFKDASGLVHVIGEVVPQTAYTPNDGGSHTMVTLPAGYRPAATRLFQIQVGSFATPVTVSITSAGIMSAINAQIQVPANYSHYLESITFHPGYTGTAPLS